MTGGKIGGIFLVLVLLACIGIFGQHFGAGISGTTSLERDTGLGLLSIVSYLFGVATFQMTGAPFWLSGFVDLLIVVFIVLVLSMFIPTVPG